MLVAAVLMAIVLALNAPRAEGVVVECSQLPAPDNATYYEVLEQMDACETLSGIKLSWPLDDRAQWRVGTRYIHRPFVHRSILTRLVGEDLQYG